MAAEGVEGITSFWPGFCQGDDPDEVSCEFNGGVAADVLNTFGIPYDTVVDGGNLDGIDIKSMDAFTAVKISLLDQSADDGRIYEPVTNGEGYVEFVSIGEFDGLNNSEVYYEIQSGTFQEECSGVMVTGRRPLAKRKKAEWKAIWAGQSREIYNTFWMAPNCLDKKYSAYATIVFRDPHLETQWEDGIDNFYEVKSPWENLIGYARYITWPGFDDSPDTDIKRASQSRIPLKISGSETGGSYDADLGTLQQKPTFPDNINEAAKGCFESSLEEADFDNGVIVEIPTKFRYETVRGVRTDKLIGVSGVYIVGLPVAEAKSIPNSGPAEVKTDPVDGDCELMLTINESQDKVFKLSEGEHYQVAIREGQDGPEIAVVFAENKRNFDPKNFGSNITFKVDPNCDFYRNANAAGNYTASILPTGGTEAYLVSQVFCIVDLDIPSITVYDPRVEQGKANEIANNLTYNLAPLISIEEPAPVAYSGRSFRGLIDMSEMQKDHDPTTQQNFEDTDYTRAMEDMDHGGGITLSLACLNERQIETLASTLYDYMNSGNGSVSTFVCSPDSNPQLGGYGYDNDSIVNEITYSYQDSNSYTISVTCGPKLLGDFAQIDGGPYYKMTEEVSARGTIIDDTGDNSVFKVLVDGYGEVLAINCSPNILRVGDKVQVTVHNNPVEA